MNKVKKNKIIISKIVKYYTRLKLVRVKQNKFFVASDKKTNMKYIRIPNDIYIFKKKKSIKFLSITNKKSINFFVYIFLNWLKNLNKIYRKILKLKGLGLKMILSEDKKVLTLKLGFSHVITMKISKKLNINIKKNKMSIMSSNTAFLSNFAKQIKQLKKYNKYNGRGFSYKREVKKYKIFKKK
jgi:ribosomal protein L6P/L9E